MKSKYSLLLITLLWCVPTFAQTVLSPMPHQCFNDVLSQGKALSGGKLYTYQSGTSIQQATFTDSTGLSANSNPIILDAAGCASIWLTSGQAYSFVAQNSAGVQEWTSDNVSGLATASASVSQAISTVAFSPTPTFTALGQYQVFRMTLTGNVTSSSLVMTGVTVPSLVTFEITQDSTGNRSFTWPLGTGGALAVNSNPNSITTQSFFWDGTTAWSLSNTYPQASIVPVELFGAKGDWNGSTGTDDTAAIQACLNSLTSGTCLLGAKSYKTTAALTITKSNVGLIGVAPVLVNTAAFATPVSSVIVSTSPSADILDVSGIDTAHAIANNVFKNFALERSVIPTGTASGLSLSYSYAAVIDGVTSMDSIRCFYFKGVGSQGFGKVDNSAAAFGYNGFTEPSGSLYGFYVDTAAGIFSPSLRIRNSFTASNLGHSAGAVWTTYGLIAAGTLLSDLHLTHFESAGTDYGIYINSGDPNFSNSSDIEIFDPILDTCGISCLYITGLGGSVTITGGWFYSSGTTAPLANIQSNAAGSQVSIVNSQFFALTNTGAGGGVLAHTAYNVQLVGNRFQFLSSNTSPIVFNAVTGGVLSSNVIWDNTATTTLISLISTLNVPIATNVLNGSATNGILLDVNTHGITGLETDTCGASIAAITNCAVDNGGNSAPFISGVLNLPVAFASLPTCVAGLEGLSRAVNNSNTAVYNAAVAGGGANHIIALCNGTAWVAH